MSINPRKHSGGSSCAVATCTHYGSKAKKKGLNLSFHRFPKNPVNYNVWIKKCRRGDKWNPKTSFICSEHFTPDSFVRDLKAELLGYTPKMRMLKSDAVPTINLPVNRTQNVISTSAINRAKKMEAKSIKEAHDKLIASILNASSLVDTLPPTDAITLTVNEELDNSLSENVDYKQLYYELLKKYNDLKAEHEKQETMLLKQSEIDYEKINECLRTKINILQKQLDLTNTILKTTQKQMSEEIKILSQNKTNSINNESKEIVSSVFSQNRLNLMQKKKKHVCWTRDHMAKAFTLRYISKRAYVYVKDELHYPLPGLSFLQHWAKTIKTSNGNLHDML